MSEAIPHPVLTDATILRQAFGRFATGVTVITVGGGAPHGMTASSFASVSLDPPLLLVCIEHDAIMHGCLAAGRSFAVSVLAGSQEDIARHFADRWRPLGLAQFDGVDWRGGPLTGAPLITGAQAHFECDLWRCYDGGDHTIFVGRLLALYQRPERDALLFFRGRFRQIHTEHSEVSA
jgi:flavin reductase (DIM6/NTAB) family NADH-FMN oxidoreductase RutF